MTTPRRTLAVLATMLVIAAGCSGNDDPSDAAGSTADAAATSADPDLATSEAGSEATSSAPLPVSSEPVADEPDPADTFAPVPETGVPGIDSEDDFCAAWSRFGGTWQVLIQAFAAGQPDAVPRLEVVAASTVADAYDELFRAWPGELESERDLVADAYFGALQRRSADALSALIDAGATDAQLDAWSEAWVQALAGYDPATPPIVVVVAPEDEALIEAAVADFVATRVAFFADPTMEITAETPLTDRYLATGCPDQGWIVGQEQ